jgi:hypothetical protein
MTLDGLQIKRFDAEIAKFPEILEIGQRCQQSSISIDSFTVEGGFSS